MSTKPPRRPIRRVALVVKQTDLGRLRSRKLSGQSTARLLLAHEEHLASVRSVKQELLARGIALTEHTSPPLTTVVYAVWPAVSPCTVT